MNNTDTHSVHSVHSVEHEGFYYVETDDGTIAKGCQRCGGTGHYSFNGLTSICYRCSNIWEYRLGDIFETRADAEKWCHSRAVAKAYRNAKRDRERLATLVERTKAWDALEASNPDVWALLTSVVNVRAWDRPDGDICPSSTERDMFVLKMADQLWSLDERPFTERQVAALQRVAEQRAERVTDAAQNPAPEGRVVVTGEIVSAKQIENEFGITNKILVKDDRGFKVWVSLPREQGEQAYGEWLGEVEANGHSVYNFGVAVWFLGTPPYEKYNGVKGRRITFTATLQPSRDDVAFAFGSRPSKGAWL